ncbi:hypothetical protein GBAR_LOCUS16954 [Geodia barretti]|uniref:Photosynthesis system II assembly factor Ycf48/Hcf136-like domain-containing protein n=1 Tax=Geodia barretti TaxID=519541 RepID=A0AA35WQA4_GEOBA|nr:hypothetical protein GBAR_LOCUS16954 [Geodia barretti]
MAAITGSNSTLTSHKNAKGVPIIPRVTTFVIDPEDSQMLYAGIEIDGMHLSTDGGETWVERSEGLSSLDIHGLCVVPGSPKTIIAATNNDVCVTTDMGQQWTPLNVKAHYPWPYCRAAFFLNGNAGSGLYRCWKRSSLAIKAGFSRQAMLGRRGTDPISVEQQIAQSGVLPTIRSSMTFLSLAV